MYKKAFGVLFLAIIIAVAGIAVMPFNKAKNNHIRPTVNYDYGQLYPLPEEGNSTAHEPLSLFDKINNKVNVVKGNLQNKVNDDFRYRMPSILLKNHYQNLLGMDMTVSFNTAENDMTSNSDMVVRFDDDSEYICGVIDDIDISQNALKLVEFGKYVENKGINFLYFHTPYKSASNEIYKDYSKEKENELINKLKESDIDYIRFNDYMPESRDEYAKMFYKTDHHWLPQTGIYANRVLCDYLNKNYGYNIDTSVFNLNNYRAETTDELFLGSWGRKVTEVYAKPETFEIYYPKYTLDLDVYNTRYNEHTHGNIEDTLFLYDALKCDLYERNNYAVYGLGDPAYMSIHNNDIHDGSRILMIKTSFANCMYSYLPAVFEDMDIIDPRYFNASIKLFIEKNKPDTVIIVYGIASYESNFTEECFDFR